MSEGEAVERADLAQDGAGGEGEGLVAVEGLVEGEVGVAPEFGAIGAVAGGFVDKFAELGASGVGVGGDWVVGRSARRGWAALQTLRPSWATVSLSYDAIPYCLPHGSAQHGSNAVSGCVA